MGEPNILITSPLAITHPEPYVSHLRNHGYKVVLHMPPGQFVDEQQLSAYSPNILALLCGDDEVTSRIIEANPCLRTVCKWGVGIDAIDWRYCEQKGITVRNVPGVHCQSMAEAACAYTLALFKRILDVDRMVRRGEWYKVLSHKFEDSVIGLVGLGDIGTCVARMMSGWPVQLLGYDPRSDAMPDFPGRRVGRDELFSSADCIVIMAPPKTERTRIHTPGCEPELDQVLHLLRPGTLYVNVSRGALTPFSALEEALDRGLIGALASDVYEIEPLPRDSRLRTVFSERAIFGAHTAYNCPGISEKVSHWTFQNLLDELGVPWPEGVPKREDAASSTDGSN